RMATSKELEELIEEVGVPLFMTSANQSGEEACRSLDEIEKCCVGIEGMLEGETQFGESSTIVDCSSNEVKIVRKGPISEEMIQKVLQGG
ncbi:MAG: Sua5/YciO/YrdC/YwlC family protein, partial [Solobacterium sp.]|nr:Sua5/YciO/YrdC/YwlC family protein [Solobacterium sp.]